MHVCQTVIIDEGIHFATMPRPQFGHYQLLDVQGSPAFLVDGQVEGVVGDLYLPETFGVG